MMYTILREVNFLMFNEITLLSPFYLLGKPETVIIIIIFLTQERDSQSKVSYIKFYSINYIILFLILLV